MLESSLSATGGGAVRSLHCVRTPSSSDFNTLYATWFKEVTRWVRVLGAPAAYCEDLAQDVFVVVHRRLHEFDGQNVGGWLYQITRHRVRDFRRGLWFRRQLLSAGIDPNLCRELRANPSESLETKRSWTLLEELLGQLKEQERVALILFEIEGLSGEEISVIQGVSIHTVFSRLRRGRTKLKAALAQFQSVPQQRAS
jgi:RNA polymerase sigma-70 factor, ECF subfamily